MDNFSVHVDGDGVALVTFDVPGRSMNTITASVQRDLDVLNERLRNDDRIRGAVLRSGKETGFCAGADLTELAKDIDVWALAQNQEDLRAGIASAFGLSRRIRALETCGKPIVVVVEGLALGGGLEFVLGCHRRLVIEGADINIAFPEARLGLLPGAGGTQRLPRLMGLAASIPYLLDCKPLSLSDALAGGVFHAALPAGQLMEAARQWILEGGRGIAPWDEKPSANPFTGPHSAVAYAQFGSAIAASLADGKSESKANILKCLYEGIQVPIDAGLRIESRYFFNTTRLPGASERIASFMAKRSSHGRSGEGRSLRQST